MSALVETLPRDDSNEEAHTLRGAQSCSGDVDTLRSTVPEQPILASTRRQAAADRLRLKAIEHYAP